MPMAPRWPSKDPADPYPLFPHGRDYGYIRGCRGPSGCRPCRDAHNAVARARTRRRAYNQTGDHDRTDSARTLARLDALLAAGHTRHGIAAAAGLSMKQVSHLAAERPAGVLVATERAVLAARPAEPAAGKQYEPVARFLTRAYALAALGYPLSWQAIECGYKTSPDGFSFPRRQQYVSRDLWDRLAALYARIGDTPAGDSGRGFTPLAMSRARAAARRHGAHPPICYDDAGRLVSGCAHYENAGQAKGAEKAALRERQAALRLTVLRHLLVDRVSNRVAAARSGLHPRVVQRWVAAAGLRFDRDDEAEQSVPAAEAAARAAVVAAAIRDWHACQCTAEEADATVFPAGVNVPYARAVAAFADQAA